MAQFMKLLVTIALTFTITTAIITTTTTRANPTTKTVALKDPFKDLTPTEAIKIRRSRFLAEKNVESQRHRNLQAFDHCNKDSEICFSSEAITTMACYNKKCMDITNDNKNCGACNKKCRFGETCCGGECANLSFDKRHCGKCNHRCLAGVSCGLGLCDYA